jgi:hypothetical protein
LAYAHKEAGDAAAGAAVMAQRVKVFERLVARSITAVASGSTSLAAVLSPPSPSPWFP